ncbi:serine/threonine-protein phosphatase 6 regulatory ankyrin repeat subunit B-like [Trichogramma pretiosum]|uniref:serine/threonine-protein phosphatase 6 regulatory ankyrin repeat subunit B-like n=1 Tax=Trichogramma pretiosum TaxID=7493 RepID=UPI000C719E14|nr:serine/threonine-protein phosphatase 6 regulatory ankyrin repeat subunit B-like [Trichogramma pretiosum]
MLLRSGADPNLAIEADGSTPLHVICRRDFRDSQDLVKLFVETSEDELNHEVQIDARDKSGRTPLHLALERDLQAVAESLLRNGASPNAADAEGMTPLHIYCTRRVDEFRSMEAFLAIYDKMYEDVQLDARNNLGYTPLLLAFERRHHQAALVLLRRGADPNIANDDEVTPLHLMCEKVIGDASLRIELSQRYPLQIDARDKWGNTPLHRAIESDNIHLAAFLLKRGASPNSANDKGVTPTHLACGIDRDVLELFFKVNDDVQNAVRVDARDNNGSTPLQWAVSKLVPDAIDVILSRGADLSSFVFPAFDRFDECLESLDMHYRTKLSVASGLVAVVERLEENGYELDRSDALTIMRSFAKYELLKKEDYSSCYKEEHFTKNITMKSNLSLYDLIQLPPKQAGKLITHADCMNFAHSCRLEGMSDEFRARCYAQLCEIISRKFFLEWALDPLVELLHYRLPILCCDMIADKLKNKDLMNICFAAELLRARRN